MFDALAVEVSYPIGSRCPRRGRDSRQPRNQDQATPPTHVNVDVNPLEMWEMRKGDQVLLSMPKAGVARAFLMSHNVKHRGQLSVFLRLCEVPMPQICGPSADESDM